MNTSTGPIEPRRKSGAGGRLATGTVAGKAALGKAIGASEARHPDGRRQRSRDSRGKIIRAMMDLIASGDSAPSAARVAERAGVGLRSVFRHFDDKESLFREMHEILTQAFLPELQAPYRSDDWRGQLFELIERRAHVYEATAPFRIATSVQRFTSPALMENYRALLRWERERLAAILPDYVRRDLKRARAILLTTSFDAWRLFRQDEELSGAQTIEVIRQMLQDILDPIGDDG